MAPAPLFPPLVPDPGTQTNQVLCTICSNILDRPIELDCGVLVCLLCITRWLTIKSGQEAEIMVECPCCYCSLIDHAHTPSRVTLNLLGEQEVICARGCNRAVKAELYMAHINSRCQACFSHSIHSPSRTTIGELLTKDRDRPTTHAEKKVARNIITRMIAEGSSTQVLQLPTGGQVHTK